MNRNTETDDAVPEASNDVRGRLVAGVRDTAVLLIGALVFAVASTFTSGRTSTLLIAGAVFLAMRPVLNLGHVVWRLVDP